MGIVKEGWIDSYDFKFNEVMEEGGTEDEAEAAALDWAEGAFERMVDGADTLRKAVREGAY